MKKYYMHTIQETLEQFTVNQTLLAEVLNSHPNKDLIMSMIDGTYEGIDIPSHSKVSPYTGAGYEWGIAKMINYRALRTNSEIQFEVECTSTFYFETQEAADTYGLRSTWTTTWKPQPDDTHIFKAVNKGIRTCTCNLKEWNKNAVSFWETVKPFPTESSIEAGICSEEEL